MDNTGGVIRECTTLYASAKNGGLTKRGAGCSLCSDFEGRKPETMSWLWMKSTQESSAMEAHSDAKPQIRQPMERLAHAWDQRLAPHFLLALGALLGLYLFIELLINGRNWLRWDWLLITGLLTYIAALHAAKGAPTKLHETLDRLAARGVMMISPAQRELLDERAERWSSIGGLVVTALMIGAFFIASHGLIPLPWIPLALLEAILGYVAGRHLGRMVFNGWLGRIVGQERISVNAEPGHIDGAAGLKPLGDFYFYQAMVVAVPVLFVAGWLTIFALWDGNPYSRWRLPYAILLPFALAFEVGAFLLPIWLFHQLMIRRKAAYVREADQCSREITELKLELAKPQPEATRKQIQETIEYKTKRYTDIDTMPTWPIDAGLRRRFATRNVVLGATPLIAEAFSRNDIVSGWLAAGIETFKAIGGGVD
jgi:hypothetical protein